MPQTDSPAASTLASHWAPPVQGMLPDYRKIPLKDIAKAGIDLSRIIPDPEAKAVPVAAFNSSI